MKHGKLLDTRFAPTSGEHETCYTCKYHDWHTQTKATVVRVQTFERVTRKTYFCDAHGKTS